MASSSSQDPAWFQELQTSVALEDGVEEEEHQVQSAILESLQQLEISSNANHETQPITSTSATHTRASTSDDALRFNELFNLTFVYFSVDGIIFTALKDWIMRPGTWFHHLFTEAAENPGLRVEGLTARTPFVLGGTTVTDFEAFLCFLYPQAKSLSTYDEWLGVLRLATRWDFIEARNAAIAALNTLISARPADKIHVGTELRVQQWLMEGLEELITMNDLAPHTLSATPYSLDWRAISKVFHARMMHEKGKTIPRQNTSCCGSYYGPSYGPTSCRTCGKGWEKYAPSSIVKNNFETELRDAIFVVGAD